MARLRSAGVPTYCGHAITAIGGTDRCTDVEIKPVDGDWHVRSEASAVLLQASSVAIGHGLVPATEVLRLLGVPHSFRPERGGWSPDIREDRSSAIAGIYAAGDCSGIAGAAAADIAGTIAGLSVARDAGRLQAADHAAQLRRLAPRFSRANRFGATVNRLMTLRPGLVRSIPDSTIVCRCEDVTRAAIDAAAAGGARHLNQLKSTTRCGMGPCQGRMCGEASAELLALASGSERIAAGQWTARTPLLPVPMTAITGDYSYDDIPKPTPAPA
jgi:NADPH-dependent 2,4-dienoyl-CoA reductase/sulfur reductase-like enzyme